MVKKTLRRNFEILLNNVGDHYMEIRCRMVLLEEVSKAGNKLLAPRLPSRAVKHMSSGFSAGAKGALRANGWRVFGQESIGW